MNSFASASGEEEDGPALTSKIRLDPDLLACEREPIHVPGAVQPHGALLAALADGLLITHASDNLAAILGCTAEAALGQPLAQIIGAAACSALLAGVPIGGIASDQTHVLIGPDGSNLHLHAFRSGRHFCVDIERVRFLPQHRSPFIMAQKVLKSFEHATSVVEVCELAVHGLKAITGYDRVMAYRFGAGGDGEVIAEACEAHLDPFLGLRYPAADIPPQARQLYLRQRVGTIADAGYVPVPLRVDPDLDNGIPIDLTHSALRSVSPIHREYMRNMKTAASLTIGLAHGNALWGMLVCHHGTTRIAEPELRAAAGTVGQVVSLLLQSLSDAELLAQKLLRNVILRALIDRISAPGPLPAAFAEIPADLLNLVDADGAMLRLAGANFFFGSTPPAAAAERMLSLLMASPRGEVLAIDDVGLRFPELGACMSQGSGALLLSLVTGGDDAILWFRPELSRTVIWGGNPAAHATVDSTTARISPRASFTAWKEMVSGRSAPWTETDLALARELLHAVQADAVQRTKAALLESEARLGLLAEHSGVVVALSDLDGVRRYVSPASERVLGWSPEDMVGRSAFDFIHPDDQQAFRDANAMLLGASGQSASTYRFRRPDGSWLWVDGHARLRSPGDGKKAKDYVVVLRDATDRKAVEIKLHEALSRMEQMAATDGLTGLANRRRFDLSIEREWRHCARERLPLSVLLLDADRFKLFNDRYGHLAGDDCLRAIASQVAAVVQRPDDLAARFGGEEFVLLLPNTSADGALSLAARLCKLVQDMEMAHAGNAGLGVVTVSIGVATALPGDSRCSIDSVTALLGAADAALYRAKSGGRNQVVAVADAGAA